MCARRGARQCLHSVNLDSIADRLFFLASLPPQIDISNVLWLFNPEIYIIEHGEGCTMKVGWMLLVREHAFNREILINTRVYKYKFWLQLKCVCEGERVNLASLLHAACYLLKCAFPNKFPSSSTTLAHKFTFDITDFLFIFDAKKKQQQQQKGQMGKWTYERTPHNIQFQKGLKCWL